MSKFKSNNQGTGIDPWGIVDLYKKLVPVSFSIVDSYEIYQPTIRTKIADNFLTTSLICISRFRSLLILAQEILFFFLGSGGNSPFKSRFSSHDLNVTICVLEQVESNFFSLNDELISVGFSVVDSCKKLSGDHSYKMPTFFFACLGIVVGKRNNFSGVLRGSLQSDGIRSVYRTTVGDVNRSILIIQAWQFFAVFLRDQLDCLKFQCYKFACLTSVYIHVL